MASTKPGAANGYAGMTGAGGSAGYGEAEEDAYLSELLGYSLERLNKEPEILRADRERILRQMQEASVTHYGAFVAAADATTTVCAQVRAAVAALDGLTAALPPLSAGCAAFSSRGRDAGRRRAADRAVAASHGPLTDLLEAPALLESCARAEAYDEALDLEAFLAKLAALHAGLAVPRLLAAEAAAGAEALLAQLLAKLRGPLQLPECLRVVGYLRRMGALSERQLRATFLASREAWLAEAVGELSPADAGADWGDEMTSSMTSSAMTSLVTSPMTSSMTSSAAHERLKRLTDAHRVGLFDAAMQYRAVFSASEEPGLESVTPPYTPAESVAAGDGGLLHSWCAHRLGLYLESLAESLPRICDGGALASVLEHAMYCGLSLGRVGLDFRPLLPPLFEARAAGLLTEGLAAASEGFQRTLVGHRWVALPAVGAAAAGREGGEAAPPYALMEHPPLAAWVNGCLAALNELRQLAPAACAAGAAAAVRAAISAAAAALLAIFSSRPPKGPEAAPFWATCRALCDVAGPYLAGCLGRIYPGGAAAVDCPGAVDPLRALLASEAPPPGAPPPAPAAAAARPRAVSAPADDQHFFN